MTQKTDMQDSRQKTSKRAKHEVVPGSSTKISPATDPDPLRHRMSRIFHRVRKMDEESQLRALDFMEGVLRKKNTMPRVADSMLDRKLRREYGPAKERNGNMTMQQYGEFLRNQLESDDRARQTASPSRPSRCKSPPTQSTADTPLPVDVDTPLPAEDPLPVDDGDGASGDDDSYDPLNESPSHDRPVLQARAISRDDPSLIGQTIYPARVIRDPAAQRANQKAIESYDYIDIASSAASDDDAGLGSEAPTGIWKAPNDSTNRESNGAQRAPEKSDSDNTHAQSLCDAQSRPGSSRVKARRKKQATEKMESYVDFLRRLNAERTAREAAEREARYNAAAQDRLSEERSSCGSAEMPDIRRKRRRVVA